MAYDLEQFISDCQAILARDPGPAGREDVRLRLERLLPEDLKPRIPELSISQLVALRFAGDAELAELTRQALDGPITDRDEIKKRVRSWRADWLRV